MASLRAFNTQAAIVLLLILGAIYLLSDGSIQLNTQATEGKYVNGEFYIEAQLVTESVFEQDMPWDFGGFGYQPIMRVIYEIPWNQIPTDVPYVWLNVTLPQEAITRIQAIANKVRLEHNNPGWVQTVMPFQIVWAKRNAPQNWEFYPVRSVMVARLTPDGIPSELHVQVDRDDTRQYLVVLIPTPYTIHFEDMIGQIPPSGTFYGWNVQSADKAYIRFAKDTVYEHQNRVFLAATGDNRVLFVDRGGHVIMSKDINFILSPGKKYPVAWDIDLKYQSPAGIIGHFLFMIILDAVTQNNQVKYIVFPIETVSPDGTSPNEVQELQNYFGLTVDYCLLPRQPQDHKFDLWEAIYNFCGADYQNITKISKITIWGKSYGGVGAIKFIMFGHPDFLNVTATAGP